MLCHTLRATCITRTLLWWMLSVPVGISYRQGAGQDVGGWLKVLPQPCPALPLNLIEILAYRVTIPVMPFLCHRMPSVFIQASVGVAFVSAAFASPSFSGMKPGGGGRRGPSADPLSTDTGKCMHVPAHAIQEPILPEAEAPVQMMAGTSTGAASRPSNWPMQVKVHFVSFVP